MHPSATRTKVSERFAFIRTIGEGATGRVFEVEDAALGGRLALKQLRRDRFPSTEHITRFKDEFRGFQRVTHPNLVKVYELISEDDDTFVLMELVEGQNFIRHIGLHPERGTGESGDTTRPMFGTAGPRRRRLLEPLAPCGAMSIERLRSSLRQLVGGVVALHSEGKVHCDLKPSNVLVTPDDRVVILDFGCATETKQEDGFVRGTLLYMAPEQYDGVYTEAVDWYAVGALLYQALTGRHPFPGRSSGHAYSKPSVHLADPRSVVAGLPDDLSDLALGLLEQHPDRRPTADEIARVVGLQIPRRPPTAAVLGRDAELNRLQGAFEIAQRDATHVVHVHGESGIGKTALLNQFTRTLVDAGSTVLSGTCYVDASVPYKGLDSLADRLATFLDRLDIPIDDDTRESVAQMFPVFARDGMPREATQDPALLRKRGVEAFRRILGLLAAEGPLVISIDDFQWSDAESIDLLADILRAPTAIGILVVLSYRSAAEGFDEATRYIRQRLPRDESIGVRALTAEVIHAMASTTGTVDETTLKSIVEESQGNPLFAAELLRAHANDLTSGPLTFENVLASRLQSLDVTQRAYLEVVALAGQPIDDELVAKAVNASRASSLEARRHLLAAALVRESQARDHTLETYHDRIREHVRGTLQVDVARTRHAALAEAYESAGTKDPETLLIHHRGAGNMDKARLNAELAGDAAASALAFDHAADLYHSAIELAAGKASKDLLVKHAKALSNGGRPTDAASAFLVALEREPNDVELKLAAGDELLRSGDVDHSLDLLGEVAASVGESIPRNRTLLRLRLFWNALKLRFVRVPLVDELAPKEDRRLDLCNSLGFRLTLEDYELGTLFRFRYLYLALKAGSRIHVANGLSFVAGMPSLMPAWLAGGIPRSEQLVAAGQKLLREGDPLLTHGMFLYAASMVDFSKGHWRAHRRELERVAALGHDKLAVGLQWSTAFVESAITAILWVEGDVVELRRRLPAYLLDARGYRAIESIHGLMGGTLLKLCDDKPEEARQLATDGIEGWPVTQWRVQHHLALIARGEIGLYEGTASRAWKDLSASWAKSKSAGFFRIHFYQLTALFLRARVALATGTLRDAERDIRYLEKRPDGWAAAVGTALRACLLVQRGHRDTAIPVLEQAVRDLERWNLGLYAAAARSRLAEITSDGESHAKAHEALLSTGVRNPGQLIQSLLPFGPTEGGASRQAS